jgi:hypothetical protein
MPDEYNPTVAMYEIRRTYKRMLEKHDAALHNEDAAILYFTMGNYAQDSLELAHKVRELDEYLTEHHAAWYVIV